jgi:hypothetical protein
MKKRCERADSSFYYSTGARFHDEFAQALA